MASVFLRAARAHLASRGQTDTISAHWQFITKTSIGPAVIVIEDVKLGRGLTVLHISLYQKHLLPQHPWVSPDSTRTTTAYITNGAIPRESGVTLRTGWSIDQPPPPVDLAKLVRGEDPRWESWIHYLRPIVQSLQNVDLYVPKEKHPSPTTHDVWVRLMNGERWLQDDLGFVIDIGPPLIVESFRPETDSAVVPEGGFPRGAQFWYPTIVASLETKKRLPEEGVSWLRYRIVCKMIERGRYDAEVLVYDETGDLVALSHHVAMAVGVERNPKTAGQEMGKL